MYCWNVEIIACKTEYINDIICYLQQEVHILQKVYILLKYEL